MVSKLTALCIPTVQATVWTGSYDVIPKVSGLNVLDNNIFHNLYISEMNILYEL